MARGRPVGDKSVATAASEREREVESLLSEIASDIRDAQRTFQSMGRNFEKLQRKLEQGHDARTRYANLALCNMEGAEWME